MNKHIRQLIQAVIITTAVSACGGGGGGGSPGGGGTVPGIDRLGVSSGTVTGFGSIFVNGVEFETDTAEFEIDDDSTGSSQSNLNIGDIVIVTFDPDVVGNVALSVFSDDAVEGPVDSIDVVGSQLVVAGQTVTVDDATSFDDRIPMASLAGLNVGDLVEVNGFFNADGGIHATRVEPGAGEVEVHGIVAGLDTVTLTFSINNLLLDYGAVPAIIDDSFAGGMFANGDFIEVKGTNFGPNGELQASKVEPDGPGIVDDGAFDDFDEVELEIEGLITRFVSATDFDVSGFPVTTTSSTVFEGGTAADLGLNVKVEVDGDLDDAGVLVATEVDIRRSNDLRVTALVDSVDANGGTLVVLGITISVDDQTRREDKSDANQEPFGLEHLTVNDYVEVRGGADPATAGNILASLLEREDPPDVLGEDTELRGIVDQVTQPSLTIAGVTIETNANTVFRDLDNSVMSAINFFNSLQVGDLVDADGTETTQTVIVADEVQLEN